MKKKLQYRLAFIVLVAAVCAFLLYKDKINLGLDLQGGIHLVLQVDVAQALQAETEQFQIGRASCRERV